VALIVAASIVAANASALGAALVVGLVSWFARRLPETPQPLRDESRATLAWQVGALFAFIALEQLWRAAGSPPLPEQPLWLDPRWVDITLPQSRIFTWQVVARFAVTLSAVVLFARWFRARRVDLGLASIEPRWRWTGPLLFISIYASIALAGLVAGLHDTVDRSRLNPAAVATAVGIAFIGAGLREELLYRLLLQTRLEALLGRWNGIFIAGMVFGAIHLSGTYLRMGGLADHALDLPLLARAAADCVLQQGVGGIIFGYLWSRFRNGWALIGLHGLLDSFSLVALTLVRGVQLG
jgi:membrane protease YdiL (CAAX protease family)